MIFPFRILPPVLCALIFLLFQGCGSGGAGTYIYTDDYFRKASSSSSELVFTWSSSSWGTARSSSSVDGSSSGSSSSRGAVSSSAADHYDIVPVSSLYSIVGVSLSGGTFRFRFTGERCSRLRVAVAVADSLSDGYSLNGERFPCMTNSISPGTDDSLWTLTVDSACTVSNLYFSNCYGTVSSSSAVSSSSGAEISSSGE